MTEDSLNGGYRLMNENVEDVEMVGSPALDDE